MSDINKEVRAKLGKKAVEYDGKRERVGSIKAACWRRSSTTFYNHNLGSQFPLYEPDLAKMKFSAYFIALAMATTFVLAQV